MTDLHKLIDESEDEKKYLARIEQLRDTLELLIVKVEQALWDRFEYTHAEIADQTKDYREILGRGPYRPEETDNNPSTL